MLLYNIVDDSKFVFFFFLCDFMWFEFYLFGVVLGINENFIVYVVRYIFGVNMVILGILMESIVKMMGYFNL